MARQIYTTRLVVRLSVCLSATYRAFLLWFIAEAYTTGLTEVSAKVISGRLFAYAPSARRMLLGAVRIL